MGFLKTSIVSTEARHSFDLKGQGVLITRPKAQAVGLEKLVREKGGVPYVFPTLEINYAPGEILNQQLQEIHKGEIVVFISANAVQGVFQNITSALRQKLAGAQIAAVGKRTQAALEAENLEVPIVPEVHQQTTEGLLSHPALQKLSGQRISIVRAQTGRETLRDQLQSRGASVRHIEAYERGVPRQYDAAEILRALAASEIKIVLISSFEAYANFTKMLGERLDKHLKRIRVVVPSERIAEKILNRVSTNIIVADNASDEAMLVAGTQ